MHFVVQRQALGMVDHRGLSKKTRSAINISEDQCKTAPEGAV
jgi:hypothetical protein